MWTTPGRFLQGGVFLWALLSAGCGNDRPADRAGTHNGSRPVSTVTDPAAALEAPPNMLAVRFREEPVAGAWTSFEKAGEPGRCSIRVILTDSRDSSATCLERWLLEPFVADPARHESVFVAVRRLAFRAGDLPGTTDASFAVIWHKRVVARVDHDTWILPGTGLAPRRTIRTRPIRSGTHEVLFVRTDSAGIAGSERYQVFGPGPTGVLQQFTGPVEHFRDPDLPATLTPGQVVYARVQVAWFTVPLPLTFEPQRARFVPEVGDDAMFGATGKAIFRGHPDGSMLIRLYLSTDSGASSMSVPIPPLTEAVARKAYLPFLVPGHRLHSVAHAGMVFVTVGSLEGWLPDSLVGRFTP